jgi:hypothetical protein
MCLSRSVSGLTLGKTLAAFESVWRLLVPTSTTNKAAVVVRADQPTVPPDLVSRLRLKFAR